MTTDQIIALAASTGACLSAIATLFSVREMSRQRAASYRPEIAVSSVVFEGTKNPASGEKLLSKWAKLDSPNHNEDQKTLQTGLALTLSNIGLGAAKAIKVRWSFPFQQAVKQVNVVAQRSLTPAYLTFENQILDLNSEALSKFSSFWQNQQTSTIDFVLPSAAERQPSELALPNAYVMLVSVYMHVAFADKTLNQIEIPTLELELEYFDISNRHHKARFEIKFTLVVASENMFRARLEVKKGN